MAYKKESNVCHFCSMLDGLVFLPSKGRMKYLKAEAPEVLTYDVDYFDWNNLSSGFRSVRIQTGAIKLRRTPPLFDVNLWNEHKATLQEEAQMNNMRGIEQRILDSRQTCQPLSVDRHQELSKGCGHGGGEGPPSKARYILGESSMAGNKEAPGTPANIL